MLVSEVVSVGGEMHCGSLLSEKCVGSGGLCVFLSVLKW